MNRFWVGHKNGKRTAFTYIDPQMKSHGDLYNAITGPFKTRRGAEWFARNPYFSGNILTAEQLAKVE